MEDFGAFYEEHVSAVTAYVARRAGRPDLTFDLVAETFARALELRPVPRARGRLAVLHRAQPDAPAAAVRLGMEPIALDDEQLASITERGSTGLAEALSRLPESQREAVIRRVLAEQEYPEIALRVGCSEQVVRQRVSRGLAALRRGLEAR